MKKNQLFIREEILKAMRKFFYQKKFHEVVTPVLLRSVPLEPCIRYFTTAGQTGHGNVTYYLAPSPESGLKKMLAQGIGNCFAVSKSFRNSDDVGPLHMPEFLMLEWYRENTEYQAIMDDVVHLIRFIKQELDRYLGRKKDSTFMYQGNQINLGGAWPVLSMADLFREYADIDLKRSIGEEAMKKAAAAKGYTTDHATWEQLFNQIFLNEIEPKIGVQPCFITDFPARISPLCAKDPDRPYLARRFEVYIAGIELGNGNTENTDVGAVRNTITKEEKLRRVSGEPVPPRDERFLDALSRMGHTSYAGIGLGIDRLAMILGDADDIRDFVWDGR